MVNVEELEPRPFLDLLDHMGLPTEIREIDPHGPEHFDGTVGPLAREIDNAVVHTTVSAADPMIAVRPAPTDGPATAS
jgi:hypothetical protein